MSLIPFILELADELHEFNRCLATGGMDVDDFGFGIYPHELQTQQQQQQHAQHPLQQQQPQQQQHLSQQRRPRSLSQFYWMPNISKSRHHPYYRGKPCCNKTPIQLVHDHHLEKESSSTVGGGSGGGGTVSGSSPTGGTTAAGDKESAANAHIAISSSHNVSTTTAASKSAYSVVNKNGFQVSMNVKQFAPNELTVKTIDNCIVVEGQHEDKEDGHGVISRHFIRKYMLPKGYDPNEVLSTLSSDGILTVKAPPPATKTDESLERIVDIQQTGGPLQVQNAAKELSTTIGNVKEDQTNAAVPGPEQAATPVAVVTGILPTSATVTLQQHQQQQKQKPQPHQSVATVECVQQQQPAKMSQPTVADLQVMRERNGNIEPNEQLVEEETELRRTAEQTATSSNSNLINNNNNNNNNNNTDTTNINSSGVKDSTAAQANSKMEGKEKKECLAEEAAEEEEGEKEKAVDVDNVNTKNSLTSKAEAIDAITTAAVADEPMQTDIEEEEVVKEVGKQTTEEDSLQTSHIEDVIPIVGAVNSVANSSTSTNNNTVTNNFTTTNDTLSIVETNGIETTTTNDMDIELTSSAAPEVNDIVVVTNNGIPEAKTAPDDLTISLETAVADIDGVTDMETDIVTEVADVADGDMDADANADADADADADGVDGVRNAVSVGNIGVGVDVNVISGDGSRGSVEDGNDESGSVGNLVVAAQSPCAGDLVAAADAAIILAKTQCDANPGVDDVVASKPAITTEEITN